jgi:hypothetical protein
VRGNPGRFGQLDHDYDNDYDNDNDNDNDGEGTHNHRPYAWLNSRSAFLPMARMKGARVRPCTRIEKTTTM